MSVFLTCHVIFWEEANIMSRKIRSRSNFYWIVESDYLIRDRSHFMTSLGGGGFQMMTIDDEGEGGFGQ